jgi:hypothetical protein
MHFLYSPGSPRGEVIHHFNLPAYNFRENVRIGSSLSTHLDNTATPLVVEDNNPETISFGMASGIQFDTLLESEMYPNNGYTYAGMNWIAHEGSDRDGNRMPPHYRTWFRNHADPDDREARTLGDNSTGAWYVGNLPLHPDHLWDHDSDLPQTSLVSFDRHDIGMIRSRDIENPPAHPYTYHYTRYATIVPVPMAGYDATGSSWKFQIRNPLPENTEWHQSDTISANTDDVPFAFATGYPFSPTPVLVRTDAGKIGMAAVFPSENGITIKGYQMHQRAGDGLPDEIIDYHLEWMETTQPYQNPRHTNCAWEIWSYKTIQTATTWSGRIYAEALDVRESVVLTPGTVVEFRPGTTVYCRGAQRFHATRLSDYDQPVFFNRDNHRPVTLIYENIGSGDGLLWIGYRFSGAFRIIIRDTHGDPDDPTRISFAHNNPATYSIPANPNGNTIELIDCDNLILEGVTIKGDPQARAGTGLYIEKCPSTVHVINSKISDVETGIVSTLSNSRFDSLTIENCSGNGIQWSNDYPAGGKVGRIDNCTIRNNGLSGPYYTGCTIYAASPILSCNTFENNNGYAVYAIGDAAPSFYDWEISKTGANSFSGVGGYPIIRIKDAAPIFASGKNNFTLGGCAAYFEDVSANPKTHDVSNNNFNPEATIDHFVPKDPKIWLFDPQSDPGVCKTQMVNPSSGASSALCAGDLFVGADDLDNARTQFLQAVALSGDTASSGSAALERLANLDPILPPVGSEMQKDAFFNLSYSYDADGNFNAADSTRDSIMTIANSFDSLRIEYDLSVSELLRPRSDKSGEIDPQQQAAAQRHRSILLDELMGVIRVTSNTSSTVPSAYALHPVYPNPFNATTTITYDLPNDGHVSLRVFDLLGREVAVLKYGFSEAGSHRVMFDGRGMASGIYFARLEAGKFSQTKKLMLLK